MATSAEELTNNAICRATFLDALTTATEKITKLISFGANTDDAVTVEPGLDVIEGGAGDGLFQFILGHGSTGAGERVLMIMARAAGRKPVG